MRRAIAIVIATSLLGACGKLQGFGGAEPPLVTFDVTFSGELTPPAPTGDTLRVTLVWGLQWLQEPFCVLPAESVAAAAVIAAGCRDPLSFVPNRVDTSVPLTPDGTASLPLLELPSADLMVGDITARVAYGSLVVYDDRDHDGTLGLSQPHPTAFGREGRGDDGGGDQTSDSTDVIYGASFVTMGAPDQRVAYREGGFDATSAFYPRAGCAPPLPGFSVVGAGGFTAAAALAATSSGTLPPEDPATCAEAKPANTVVPIAAQASTDLAEIDCDERTADSSTRYHEPPAMAPDFTGRATACAHLPTFDTGDAGTQSSLIQLAVSGRSTDRCRGVTHYALRGCRENVSCPVPDWDLTASPPSWWPCPH